MTARPIQLALTPDQAFDAWPGDWPLAALWSGDPSASRSRWTVLARPSRFVTFDPRAATDPFLPPEPAIGEVDSRKKVFERGRAEDGSPTAPFQSGWIGFLSYDLGRILEPRARHSEGIRGAADWPLSVWARCDDALIYDHAEARWWLAGSSTLAEHMLSHRRTGSRSPFTISSLTPATPHEAYIRGAARVLDYIRAGDIYQANLAHRLTAEFSGSARGLFAALAARARPWYGAYLEFEAGSMSSSAGSATVRGGSVARRAILSLSPELFLSFDPATRLVETRPMKGTRAVPQTGETSKPGGAPPDASTSARSAMPSACSSDLYTSEKDRAELNMIIDLLRNDLGRVCDFGSVRVNEPRVIEQHGASPAHPSARVTHPSTLTAHPSLLQATATISGRLRDHLSLADLLRATFPGGSITGAPKIRAMQIIDELESAARGPYCGSIGFIADTGHAAFNIAIRTALISATTRSSPSAPAEGMPNPRGGGGSSDDSLDQFSSATLSYSVGAGIVADSSPEAEWQETLDKASIWSGVTDISGYAGPHAPSATTARSSTFNAERHDGG